MKPPKDDILRLTKPILVCSIVNTFPVAWALNYLKSGGGGDIGQKWLKVAEKNKK